MIENENPYPKMGVVHKVVVEPEAIQIMDAYINFSIDKKANETKYQLNFILPGILPVSKEDLQLILKTISEKIVTPDATV